MEFDLFTVIIGFMALAVIMNRSTVSVMGHIDRVRKESDQRLDQFRTELGECVASIRQEMGQLRAEIGEHVAGIRQEMGHFRTELGEQVVSIRQEMNQFRTEMNRRFDEANTEMNRRFDTIGHDMADLRERITRVEEAVKTRETPNQSAA